MNKNRRMKHVVAASLAFGAAALTGFGQIAPAAVYAAEQTETVKTESTKAGEQADEGLFKERNGLCQCRCKRSGKTYNSFGLAEKCGNDRKFKRCQRT